MAKKILVVGGGGREHAIIKALKKSPDCGEIWCAPGNGGIGYDAKCKNIKATDVETMVAFAAEEKFDYVVVAQDDPLALGMVDALAAVGIPAFGPDKAAARIEASKVFSKDLMKKYGIPTADYATFDDPAKVMDYIKAKGKYPWSSRPTAGTGQGRADLRERGTGRRRREGDHAGQKVRRFRQPCGGGRVPHRP
jgi:purD: phosphoribosylamine--glycine ligase